MFLGTGGTEGKMVYEIRQREEMMRQDVENRYRKPVDVKRSEKIREKTKVEMTKIEENEEEVDREDETKRKYEQE